VFEVATKQQGKEHTTNLQQSFMDPFSFLQKLGMLLTNCNCLRIVKSIMSFMFLEGTNHQVGSLLEYGRDGVLSVELEAIIRKRLGKLHNKAVLYVLVKWVNQAEEDTTWELYTDLIKRFPQMELHS
ncbi:retrotransposable element Tf2, partial [Tanacetum coccineum]